MCDVLGLEPDVLPFGCQGDIRPLELRLSSSSWYISSCREVLLLAADVDIVESQTLTASSSGSGQVLEHSEAGEGKERLAAFSMIMSSGIPSSSELLDSHRSTVDIWGDRCLRSL